MKAASANESAIVQERYEMGDSIFMRRIATNGESIVLTLFTLEIALRYKKTIKTAPSVQHTIR